MNHREEAIMKEVISVRNQILWLLFLSLYPVVSTVFLYVSIPKNSGYGGMVYDMFAVLYFAGCFIANIILINLTARRMAYLNEQAWMYIFPVLSPVFCVFWLVPF